MHLFSTTALSSQCLLASGLSVSSQGLVAEFQQVLSAIPEQSFSDTVTLSELNPFISQIQSSLQQARSLNLDDSWAPEQQAFLAHSFASVERQLTSFDVVNSGKHHLAEQASLLFSELESLTQALQHKGDARTQVLPGLEEVIDSELGVAPWQKIAQDYDDLAKDVLDDRDHLPLVHGLGSIGLALGTRMALKLGGAEWYQSLSGRQLENSAQVYLYGHTPAYVEELNKTHRVDSKMETVGAWIHPKVFAIGKNDWLDRRTQASSHVAAIKSNHFLSVLIEDNFQFWRDLPNDARLISPIKSQILESDKNYQTIKARYEAEFRDRNQGAVPSLQVGGASMKDIYQMIGYITHRSDVRAIHVGGEYFAENMFFLPNERPRKIELVFASEDVADAIAMAKLFEIPGELEISTTSDVDTVLLGGVMKNIVAYALGLNDVSELYRAFVQRRQLWNEQDFDHPGSNGYVDDFRELKGERANWYRSYLNIAEEVSGNGIEVPKEVLKDFCGCTWLNRKAAQELFNRMMNAYEVATTADTAYATALEVNDLAGQTVESEQSEKAWAEFRAVIVAIAALGSSFAKSRNRRGGFRHALMIFIKETLGRPEDARLLFTEQTIEGYNAMLGLHDFLKTRHGRVAHELESTVAKFYTRHGVPTHAELDPNTHKMLREALWHGIHFSDEHTGQVYSIPAKRLADILRLEWVGVGVFGFIAQHAENLIDHIHRERKGLRVIHDFEVFLRGLDLIEQGNVGVSSAEVVSSRSIGGYQYVYEIRGNADRGQGQGYRHFFVGLSNDQGPNRVRDIALLLARHQQLARDEQIKVTVNVDGRLNEAEALNDALGVVLDRYQQYHYAPIQVRLTQTASRGLQINQSGMSDAQSLSAEERQRNRQNSIEEIASLTGGLSVDAVEQEIRRHTQLVSDMVTSDGWVGLGFAGRGRYSNALKDAMLIPGDRFFLGIYESSKRYPSEVFAAGFNAQGALVVFDSHIAHELAEYNSNAPAEEGVSSIRDDETQRERWRQAYEGFDLIDFVNSYSMLTPTKDFDRIGIVPLQQFPLEEILVGRQADVRPIDLARFFQRQGEQGARDFFQWLESYYFDTPDRDHYLDIAEYLSSNEEE